MFRSGRRTFKAEGPASAKVAVNLLCFRKRRMELFRQGPDLEGPHRLTAGVWYQGSLEFFIGLRSLGVCSFSWLNACGNSQVSACTG